MKKSIGSSWRVNDNKVDIRLEGLLDECQMIIHGVTADQSNKRCYPFEAQAKNGLSGEAIRQNNYMSQSSTHIKDNDKRKN